MIVINDNSASHLIIFCRYVELSFRIRNIPINQNLDYNLSDLTVYTL
jgi:hypothetical protein